MQNFKWRMGGISGRNKQQGLRAADLGGKGRGGSYNDENT